MPQAVYVFSMKDIYLKKGDDNMTSEKAFEQKKDLLMNQIIESGYFKTEDGRHLYELNLSELEQTHQDLQNQKVREV
jgi:hypothetical protein